MPCPSAGLPAGRHRLAEELRLAHTSLVFLDLSLDAHVGVSEGVLLAHSYDQIGPVTFNSGSSPPACPRFGVPELRSALNARRIYRQSSR